MLCASVGVEIRSTGLVNSPSSSLGFGSWELGNSIYCLDLLRMKVKMHISRYSVAETRLDISGTCGLLLSFRDEEIELQRS